MSGGESLQSRLQKFESIGASPAKAQLDGNYRKQISDEAYEAVRRRKEQDEKERQAREGFAKKPERWVPVINSTDSEEVIQLKKRIQKKEEEIQDMLKRLDAFNAKLGQVADSIVPL
mmetsp:Transcript_38264/g.151412  ORF Transcript_38264/g.151412 Transcript_38264/m.151412 type:complete len:117 (-) Transcript_38264:244-594(-)